jgi:hypothetical protein
MNVLEIFIVVGFTIELISEIANSYGNKNCKFIKRSYVEI